MLLSGSNYRLGYRPSSVILQCYKLLRAIQRRVAVARPSVRPVINWSRPANDLTRLATWRARRCSIIGSLP